MPEGSTCTVSIMHESQIQIIAAAIVHGDHIRVGTEDYPFSKSGQFASTFELVEEATDIAERVEQVATEIESEGGECLSVKGDVSNESDVKAFVDQVMRVYGRVDALINNAGTVVVKPLEEITWTDFRRVVDVNLGGIFLFCKHVRA